MGHSLYPTLLTSYITTTNGSPFSPGRKFSGVPFLWLPTARQTQEINKDFHLKLAQCTAKAETGILRSELLL